MGCGRPCDDVHINGFACGSALARVMRAHLQRAWRRTARDTRDNVECSGGQRRGRARSLRAPHRRGARLRRHQTKTTARLKRVRRISGCSRPRTRCLTDCELLVASPLPLPASPARSASSQGYRVSIECLDAHAQNTLTCCETLAVEWLCLCQPPLIRQGPREVVDERVRVLAPKHTLPRRHWINPSNQIRAGFMTGVLLTLASADACPALPPQPHALESPSHPFERKSLLSRGHHTAPWQRLEQQQPGPAQKGLSP